MTLLTAIKDHILTFVNYYRGLTQCPLCLNWVSNKGDDLYQHMLTVECPYVAKAVAAGRAVEESELLNMKPPTV
jgi:hypothetical protein